MHNTIRTPHLDNILARQRRLLVTDFVWTLLTTALLLGALV